MNKSFPLPNHHKFIDLTDKRFGRLKVESYAGNQHGNTRPTAKWNCLCDCGKRSVVSGSVLRAGDSNSCGCLLAETRGKSTIKHGKCKSGAYESWQGIKDRCLNQNNKSFKNYGGRGISVCDRWLESFENFFEDMGPRPPRLTIERVNNEKGYSPDNCQWATRKVQNIDKRNNNYITHEGITLHISEWSIRTRIDRHLIYRRIFKLGWSIKEALTIPVESGRILHIPAQTRRSRFIVHDGHRRTVPAWSRITGISQNTIRQRIDKLGWSVERALTP